MAQIKKRSRLIHKQRLGDVPELIHLIQLALPTKDASRTCILSKSWLHAWSTILAIRFSPSVDSLRKKQHQRKYMRWIYRTLLRYHQDNLPITSLNLQLCIHTALRSAYKLIMEATNSKSRSSLNELHLAILSTTSFTFPDEIFSSENLHTLRLKLIYLTRLRNPRYSLHFSINPSIHCTNLRVLKLVDVHLIQYVLHKLLSTCKLLQKIDIELPVELNTIKVNNLRYIDELRIYNLSECDNIFQVDDVLSLRSLVYDTFPKMWFRPVLFKPGTIQSLRELSLDN
ncbi:pleckstrin domain superfamily protein [Tanacetum coccineum]